MQKTARSLPYTHGKETLVHVLSLDKKKTLLYDFCPWLWWDGWLVVTLIGPPPPPLTAGSGQSPAYSDISWGSCFLFPFIWRRILPFLFQLGERCASIQIGPLQYTHQYTVLDPGWIFYTTERLPSIYETYKLTFIFPLYHEFSLVPTEHLPFLITNCLYCTTVRLPSL